MRPRLMIVSSVHARLCPVVSMGWNNQELGAHRLLICRTRQNILLPASNFFHFIASCNIFLFFLFSPFLPAFFLLFLSLFSSFSLFSCPSFSPSFYFLRFLQTGFASCERRSRDRTLCLVLTNCFAHALSCAFSFALFLARF